MKKIMFNDTVNLTQAVIGGRKTQTRRGEKWLETIDGWKKLGYTEMKTRGQYLELHDPITKEFIRHIMPYQVGEIVAVAQSYYNITSLISHYGEVFMEHNITLASAGYNNKMFVKSDLMPYRIEITEVWVERLQGISDEDCLKEGITYLDDFDKFYFERKGRSEGFYFTTPREAFASLIDKVSGKGTWNSNPFVWRYEFKIINNEL